MVWLRELYIPSQEAAAAWSELREKLRLCKKYWSASVAESLIRAVFLRSNPIAEVEELCGMWKKSTA